MSEPQQTVPIPANATIVSRLPKFQVSDKTRLTPAQEQVLLDVFNNFTAPHLPDTVVVLEPGDFRDVLRRAKLEDKTNTGFTTHGKDGKRHVFLNQDTLDQEDLGTLFHELGHVNRRDIPPQLQSEAQADQLGADIRRKYRAWKPLRESTQATVRAMPLKATPVDADLIKPPDPRTTDFEPPQSPPQREAPATVPPPAPPEDDESPFSVAGLRRAIEQAGNVIPGPLGTVAKTVAGALGRQPEVERRIARGEAQAAGEKEYWEHLKKTDYDAWLRAQDPLRFAVGKVERAAGQGLDVVERAVGDVPLAKTGVLPTLTVKDVTGAVRATAPMVLPTAETDISEYALGGINPAGGVPVPVGKGKGKLPKAVAELAEKLGLEFRGLQEGVAGKHPGLAIFQDTVSGTSVGVRADELTAAKLTEHVEVARERMKPIDTEKLLKLHDEIKSDQFRRDWLSKEAGADPLAARRAYDVQRSRMNDLADQIETVKGSESQRSIDARHVMNQAAEKASNGDYEKALSLLDSGLWSLHRGIEELPKAATAINIADVPETKFLDFSTLGGQEVTPAPRLALERQPSPKDQPWLQRFDIKQNDAKVGTLRFELSADGKTAQVNYIGPGGIPKGKKIEDVKPMDLGPAGVRSLIKEFRKEYPNVEKITGLRLTGAHGRSLVKSTEGLTEKMTQEIRLKPEKTTESWVDVERYSDPGKEKGFFYAPPGEAPAEFGPALTKARINEAALYHGKSSYDLLEAEKRLDDPVPADLLPRIKKAVKEIKESFPGDSHVQGLPDEPRTIREALEFQGIGPEDFSYDLLQQEAEKVLRPRGFKGAKWSEEDDLTPRQYQIWDRSVVKHDFTKLPGHVEQASPPVESKSVKTAKIDPVNEVKKLQRVGKNQAGLFLPNDEVVTAESSHENIYDDLIGDYGSQKEIYDKGGVRFLTDAKESVGYIDLSENKFSPEVLQRARKLVDNLSVERFVIDLPNGTSLEGTQRQLSQRIMGLTSDSFKTPSSTSAYKKR